MITIRSGCFAARLQIHPFVPSGGAIEAVYPNVLGSRTDAIAAISSFGSDG